jgi:predicted Zn-dependent protease
VQGQDQLLNIAREYLRNAEYEKSAETFKQLMTYQPNNEEIISGYYKSLLELENFKEAEKFIQKRIKKDKSKKGNYLLLASLYKKLDEPKKQRKALAKFTNGIGQNEQAVKSTAIELDRSGFTQEAIALYEYGKKKNKENAFLFAEELAVLYAKTGKQDKATESLLDLYVIDSRKSESIKSSFQQMFSSPEASDKLRKKVLKRSSKDPDNLQYYELLSWIYIQQDDYTNAYRQIKSIDVRQVEKGRRVLGFARTCLREKKYEAALKSYQYVMDQGKNEPYYKMAASEKLTTLKNQLLAKPNYTKADIQQVADAYETFLEENNAFKLTASSRERADLLARYLDKPGEAIAVLQEVVDAPRAKKQLKGRCKLDMGDYELLRGRIWESTLLYSQVDKSFKQDLLGEEAQFKNAKLSFYNGDFKWSQAQLDILKASTSELISNDAIDLSVLITENNPIKDSNDTPLKMFARADLKVFQHKYDDAYALLDSIDSEYPAHPLGDNILMARANMSMQKQQYNDAAKYYQKIVDKHAKDVLADDALYQLALLYENNFNNTSEAQRLYEQLILDYPGSTFAERARKSYRRLRGDSL